jgi:FAD synthetase
MRILIFGTFDHLHPGHAFVLEEALRRGEAHVVVARDGNVAKIKGRKPDQTEEERKVAIEKAFPAAHVLLGDPDDFLVPIRSVNPDLILLGYDQKLPPGVSEADIQIPIERLQPHHPEKFKSSLRRGKSG